MVGTTLPLAELYLADETAWLDAMAELIGAGEHSELDYANLREYLRDMANRDRREVMSRLKQLLLHILKWEHQPGKRTRSWSTSILDQQQDLAADLESGVLRNHAEAAIEQAYVGAVRLASNETELPSKAFPSECPYSLDELLAYEAPE